VSSLVFAQRKCQASCVFLRFSLEAINHEALATYACAIFKSPVALRFQTIGSMLQHPPVSLPCIRLLCTQSVRRPLDRTQHCDCIGRRGARSCNFRLRSCIKIFESGSEISSNLRIRAPCLGVSRNKLGRHFTGLGLPTKRAIFFVAQ